MDSHVYMVLPPVLYLVACWLLKRVMRTRKAIEVPTWFQALHNGFLVLLSIYMAVTILYEAFWVSGYGFTCNQVVPGPRGYPMAHVLWIFTVSKIYEFLDTFIMILRKKDDQVSFLHVYHHATIYTIWWINVKYSPGGETFQSAAMNSIVHIVMYAYYFLRTVNPNGDYWWKRYITQMQILQFVMFVTQGITLLYYECCSLALTWMNELYAWTLLALFVQFYLQGYVRNPRTKLVADKKKK